VKALIQTGDDRGVDLSVLRAVDEGNSRQKSVLVEKLMARFGEDLSGKRFAVWGLAFKPETDDMRDAPSLSVISALLKAGATVAAHDPVASDVAREHYLGDSIDYARDEYTACEGADALIVVTEWLQYRRPAWSIVREKLSSPIVFDGRNVYELDKMRESGFEYYSIGRSAVS
jgi:UDPglucose 6-dehydrogenase